MGHITPLKEFLVIATEYLTRDVVLFRFYRGKHTNPYEPFCGTCVFCIDPLWPTRGWIKGLHGTVTRAHLIAMATWLYHGGFEVAYAERIGGKRLPGFTQLEGFQMTRVEWWIDRFSLQPKGTTT